MQTRHSCFNKGQIGTKEIRSQTTLCHRVFNQRNARGAMYLQPNGISNCRENWRRSITLRRKLYRSSGGYGRGRVDFRAIERKRDDVVSAPFLTRPARLRLILVLKHCQSRTPSVESKRETTAGGKHNRGNSEERHRWNFANRAILDISNILKLIMILTWKCSEKEN